MIQFSIQCWKDHNTVVYGETNADQHRIIRNKLKVKVQMIYQAPPILAVHLPSHRESTISGTPPSPSDMTLINMGKSGTSQGQNDCIQTPQTDGQLLWHLNMAHLALWSGSTRIIN